MRISILNWIFGKEKNLPTLEEHIARVNSAEFGLAELRRKIVSKNADFESVRLYDRLYDQKFMDLIRLYSEKTRR